MTLIDGLRTTMSESQRRESTTEIDRMIRGFRSFQTTAMRAQSPRLVLRLGGHGELFTMTPPLVITSDLSLHVL